jgi:hypothetical protein
VLPLVKLFEGNPQNSKLSAAINQSAVEEEFRSQNSGVSNLDVTLKDLLRASPR